MYGPVGTRSCLYILSSIVLTCLADRNVLPELSVKDTFYQLGIISNSFVDDKNPRNVTVDLHSSFSTNSDFISLCISSSMFQERRWKHFNTSSKKLQNLAHGLSPAHLRLGGTNADFLTFVPDGQTSSQRKDDLNYLVEDSLLDTYQQFPGLLTPPTTNFIMTGKQWDLITNFSKTVGLDIMFDFNIFKRDGVTWDPSNAELLLNYSSKKKMDLPAFQLGNEPNAFRHVFNKTITPEMLVKDFQTLRKSIEKFPDYKNSLLFGPDVTNLDRHSSSRTYLKGFLDAGGSKVVDQISLHHYYLDGRTAKVDDFVNPKVLDYLRNELDYAFNMTKPYFNPVSFTETSSCYGGGAPGLSDGFVAGFLWLDKLGLAAQYGMRQVFRQTFFGGQYALVTETYDPNPDYFLSVLFKRLIEGPVFQATVVPVSKYLRMYAHCARDLLYKKGALALYYLNLKDKTKKITLSQYAQSSHDLYILTGGDDQGLKSRYVKLNGNLLKMSGSDLPDLKPVTSKGDIELPPHSFGFIIIPDANIPLCSK